jgi:hypothetical protein
MKKYIITCLITLIFSVIYSQDIKENINIIVDQWHKDAAESNFDAYFGAMSNDGVFIGTDALENWTVSEFKEFSKPFFEEKNTWDFKTLERNIYSNSGNNIVWFDELLDTWMGICRGSGVLLRDKKDWKIVHYVLSIAVPNENIKEVIVTKKENDDILIDLFKEN